MHVSVGLHHSSRHRPALLPKTQTCYRRSLTLEWGVAAEVAKGGLEMKYFFHRSSHSPQPENLDARVRRGYVFPNHHQTTLTAKNRV